jgi:hypothetical protein
MFDLFKRKPGRKPEAPAETPPTERAPEASPEPLALPPWVSAEPLALAPALAEALAAFCAWETAPFAVARAVLAVEVAVSRAWAASRAA